MMTSTKLLTAFAVAGMLTTGAMAQTPKPPATKPVGPKPAASIATQKPMHKIKEQKAGLLKQAKVTPDAAEATAVAQVPGKVVGREIESQKGVLVYAFDVKETGKDGYQEVTVDANTGAFVASVHEGGKTKKPALKPDSTKKPI
jgi:hypothetical protein